MSNKARVPLSFPRNYDDARRKLFRIFPHMEAAIDKVRRDVFGYYPKGIAEYGGYHWNRKQPKLQYIGTYYPDNIMKHAYKIEKGIKTEQQIRREEKLVMLRRKGMGPPKKGAGKRSKKR